MVAACTVLNICIRTRFSGLLCFVLPVASQLGLLHWWESIKSKVALFIFPLSSPLTGAKQWAAARTWYTALTIRPVFSMITSIIFIQGDWAAGRNPKYLTTSFCCGSLLYSFFQLEMQPDNNMSCFLYGPQEEQDTAVSYREIEWKGAKSWGASLIMSPYSLFI